MSPEAILQSATQIYVSMPCTPQVAVNRARELSSLVEARAVFLEAASGVLDEEDGA